MAQFFFASLSSFFEDGAARETTEQWATSGELRAQKHLCLCVHSPGLALSGWHLWILPSGPGDQHVGAASQMRNREITKPPSNVR